MFFQYWVAKLFNKVDNEIEVIIGNKYGLCINKCGW